MYNEIKTHFHRNFLYQKIKERSKSIIHLCPYYRGRKTLRDQSQTQRGLKELGQCQKPGQGKFPTDQGTEFLHGQRVRSIVGVP